MSAEETDQSKYLNDIGMFHRLEDARELLRGEHPISERVESAFLQIMPLKPEDLPEQFRDELKWIHDNTSSKPEHHYTNGERSVEEFMCRMAEFLDAVLRWREEYQ